MFEYDFSSKFLKRDNQNNSGNFYSILVAEDEELNFILLKEILAHLNVQVIRARDGVEAVEIVDKTVGIHLVLMDLKMPIMDGYEATKIIKNKWPLLPVLALTAYSHDSDKERAIDCGCSDFIIKPFNRVDLIEKMATHLLKRNSGSFIFDGSD